MAQSNRSCANCDRPVPAGHRKYCASCAPKASAIWKRMFRKQLTEKWIAAGCQGPAPWKQDWADDEARKAYFRNYMKTRRAKQKSRGKIDNDGDSPVAPIAKDPHQTDWRELAGINVCPRL